MKTKALLINFVLACAVLVSPVLAQEAPLSDGAASGGIDTQGRISSLLGPADTLDIRFFVLL